MGCTNYYACTSAKPESVKRPLFEIVENKIFYLLSLLLALMQAIRDALMGKLFKNYFFLMTCLAFHGNRLLMNLELRSLLNVLFLVLQTPPQLGRKIVHKAGKGPAPEYILHRYLKRRELKDS